MICPDCKGTGESVGLAKIHNEYCKWMRLPCNTCKGSGLVSNNYYEHIKIGAEFRAYRQFCNFSVGMAARLLCLSLIEISDIEHGLKEPPDDWKEKFFELKEEIKRKG
jgi:hypothetical protein